MYVLDGGLGSELEKIADIKGSKLWSGHVVKERPQLVEKVYENYINSGSTLITTATYQASYDGLKDTDMDTASVGKFWDQCVGICERSIEKSGKKCGIIGSIGPFGSYINDGSEYTGEYTVDVEKLIEHHRPLVEYYETDDRVDFIGFETVPNKLELDAILQLNVKKPYYVSFCFNDQMGVSDVEEVLKKLGGDYRNLVAIGVNCVDYKDVISYLRQFTIKLQFVVYPNLGFERGFAKDVEGWKQEVKRWSEMPSFGIGGCCSTGPEEIAIIASVVSEATQKDT